MDTATIERAVLHLLVSERAELAYKLLLSEDNMSEAEIEAAWFDEAKRRAVEIDQGLVQPITAEAVSRKVRDLLK